MAVNRADGEVPPKYWKPRRELGIPIIHIDATGTNPTLIRWSGLDELPVQAETPDALPARPFDDALPGLIDKLARPPVEAAERKGPVRYLKQRFRACNPFFAFPLLMTALLVRVFKMTDVFPNRPDALSGKFLELLAPAVGNDLFPRSLVEAYARADAVGLYFAQFFRSAFVLNFFMASFAVAAALSSLLKSPPSRWSFGIEIALISIRGAEHHLRTLSRLAYKVGRGPRSRRASARGIDALDPGNKAMGLRGRGACMDGLVCEGAGPGPAAAELHLRFGPSGKCANRNGQYPAGSVQVS